jgi:hypoxanthine-guanine phosphoribosyltransferase
MMPYHTFKLLALQHHSSSSVNLASTVIRDITYRLPDHRSLEKGTQGCVPFHGKLVRSLRMCLTKPDFYQVASTYSGLHTFFTQMESAQDHNDIAQTFVEFAQVVAIA